MTDSPLSILVTGTSSGFGRRTAYARRPSVCFGWVRGMAEPKSRPLRVEGPSRGSARALRDVPHLPPRAHLLSASETKG